MSDNPNSFNDPVNQHPESKNPKASILVVEDDSDLREALCDTLEMAGYQVIQVADGRSAIDALHESAHNVDMVISDVQMPKMDGHTLLKQIKYHYPELPVLLMTAYGTITKAIEAMKEGAVDYLVKPFEAEVLVNAVSLYVGDNQSNSEMIATSETMQRVAQLAQRVADSDATVMINGESGTGKEVLARFIHNNSPRAQKPFVAINCAAIPENMLEATLFGYEKGAFTGAYKSMPGKFEQAQQGTLLLDEITEMDQGLQAKLLRVLQEKEVERLGGQNLIELDVRVLATSNRDLKLAVQEGKFREDLYYRLNVFPIGIPALRERCEDIVPLAEFLVARIAKNAGKPIPEFSMSAKEKLSQHHWPGNIRELENVMQRAFILHREGVVEADDLPFESEVGMVCEQSAPVSLNNGSVTNIAQTTPESASQAPSQANTGSANTASPNAETLGEDLKMREYQKILSTLHTTLGNRKMASKRLGISERTLRYKMARMRDEGIEIPGSFGAKTA